MVYLYVFYFFLSFATFDAQFGISISKYNWYRFCNFNKIHHWIPISGRLMFYRIIVLEKKDKMVAIWQKSIQPQMSNSIQYSLSLISWNTVAFTSNSTLHQGLLLRSPWLHLPLQGTTYFFNSEAFKKNTFPLKDWLKLLVEKLPN